MKDSLQNSLYMGLNGSHSHINPMKAISDLTVNIARKRVNKSSHSIWELLYHLVVWQDILIENIKGNNPDWEGVQSWPTEEIMQTDDEFLSLLRRYQESFRELETLIKTVDLSKPHPFWQEYPILQYVVIAITHTSYHIGQIIATKKGLN